MSIIECFMEKTVRKSGMNELLGVYGSRGKNSFYVRSVRCKISELPI